LRNSSDSTSSTASWCKAMDSTLFVLVDPRWNESYKRTSIVFERDETVGIERNETDCLLSCLLRGSCWVDERDETDYLL